jgi:hypothetical protein
MRSPRPPVTRGVLIAVVALGGALMGTQSRLVVPRFGWEVYLAALLLLVVALAALARPPRRS